MRPYFAIVPLALALGLASPALADDRAQPSTISITGSGEVSAVPDTATVTSGVTTDGKTAREALDANTAAMTALIDALKALGIEAKDIQTSNFSVTPQYVYSNETDANGYAKPPKMVGYQVSNSVSVRVRDLPKLGEYLDKMVTVGANTIGGVSFSVADTSKLLDEARKLAFDSAKAKASVYGDAAGLELGRILSISENASYGVPEGYAIKAMDAVSAAPVPVQAGEMTYSISVNVQWEVTAK